MASALPHARESHSVPAEAGVLAADAGAVEAAELLCHEMLIGGESPLLVGAT
jgi:hypothetical protein